MIKFFTLLLLDIFDSYNQAKIFTFLKKRGYKNFKIFFDVGAHKGESIMLYLKNFNINKIFSFEASPLNFKKLSKNLSKIRRKYKNADITIENLAAGSENKKIVIKQLTETSSSTINEINPQSKYYKKKSFLMSENSQKSYLELEANQIKLSDYIDKKNLDKIDFLKVDTEGYEYNVLKGLGGKISAVSLIMFEHHYDDMLKKNYSFGDIHQLLISNNFKQIYKYKMSFRKTFEYIYEKK
jgi:FkbM family methyltransferase